MRILFISFILFFSISVTAQKGGLRGYVYDNVERLPVKGAVIKLTPSGRITIADGLGRFKIDSLAPGKYVVQIIAVGFTTKTENMTIGDSLEVLYTNLRLPCKYDAHKNDQTCPTCHKKSKVVPIVHGLPVGEMDHDNYYYAGCETTGCDPNWYCKRDKKKF